MSSVPMPRDLSEEAVAAFMREVCCLNVQRIPAAELREWERSSGKEGWRIVAAHVLAMIEADRTKHRALVREKVREAVVATTNRREVDVPLSENTFTIRDETDDEIVSRVMGDPPSTASGGHDEPSGRDEAPRG